MPTVPSPSRSPSTTGPGQDMMRVRWLEPLGRKLPTVQASPFGATVTSSMCVPMPSISGSKYVRSVPSYRIVNGYWGPPRSLDPTVQTRSGPAAATPSSRLVPIG